MKFRIVFLPLLLLSISLLSTPVQAEKPRIAVVKERQTEWIDSTYYVERLIHTVIVGKSYNMPEKEVLGLELTTRHEHVYDSEGNLVAIVKIEVNYVGIFKTGEWWTGKMVMDWTINLMEDVSGTLPPDLKGHWVIWLEEGDPVKEIGFGVGPIFL